MLLPQPARRALDRGRRSRPGSGLTDPVAALLSAREALPADWGARTLSPCLSGGGDSTALAVAVAAAWRARPDLFPGGILALHVRHGLRGPESEADAAAVQALCARLELPFRSVVAPVAPGSGLEARAREARYAALRAAAPEALLATAHQREDRVETLVLRLLRGAGARGLAGLRTLRDDGVWRPLLECGRGELRAWLVARGIAWREDPSNRDERHLRNWVRHTWLPEAEIREPGTFVALESLARSAEGLRPFLERRLDALETVAEAWTGTDGFALDLAPWRGATDDPELDLVLSRLWGRLGRRPWADQQRARLLADAASGHAGRRFGGQGERACWAGGWLEIESLPRSVGSATVH